jgi:glycosyltransferase involved in cell wall biosynthesis
LKIAIGIPAFNEEKNIASIILQLQKITKNIIVCDDGSQDMTAEIAEKLGTELIKHEKNLGYGAAIRSIFLKAREMNVDALVTFDADGQHRIEDIEKVLKPIKDENADIVIGSRFLNEPENVPKYREIGIKAITSLTNATTGEKITDAQSGFRCYNKKVLKNLNPSEYGMGISTEILIKASKLKFKIVEIPIKILYDGDTSKHHPVSHGVSVILSTMKYVSIERPLVFYGIPGVILFGIGLFFLVWTLQIFAVEGVIITNIALAAISGVFLGSLMMLTAIILFSMVSVVREKN